MLVLTETKPRGVVAAKPQYEEDPYFHYPLYNQTNFRGNIVWAWTKRIYNISSIIYLMVCKIVKFLCHITNFMEAKNLRMNYQNTQSKPWWIHNQMHISQVFCFHEICNMTQKFHDFTYHAFSYDTEMICLRWYQANLPQPASIHLR